MEWFSDDQTRSGYRCPLFAHSVCSGLVIPLISFHLTRSQYLSNSFTNNLHVPFSDYFIVVNICFLWRLFSERWWSSQCCGIMSLPSSWYSRCLGRPSRQQVLLLFSFISTIFFLSLLHRMHSLCLIASMEIENIHVFVLQIWTYSWLSPFGTRTNLCDCSNWNSRSAQSLGGIFFFCFQTFFLNINWFN
jgi:hypothetical protein